jgi:hypothetical protein
MSVASAFSRKSSRYVNVYCNTRICPKETPSQVRETPWQIFIRYLVKNLSSFPPYDYFNTSNSLYYLGNIESGDSSRLKVFNPRTCECIPQTQVLFVLLHACPILFMQLCVTFKPSGRLPDAQDRLYFEPAST